MFTITAVPTAHDYVLCVEARASTQVSIFTVYEPRLTLYVDWCALADDRILSLGTYIEEIGGWCSIIKAYGQITFVSHTIDGTQETTYGLDNFGTALKQCVDDLHARGLLD